MSVELRDDQQIPITLRSLDSEDNPAAATYAWRSDDEEIATVTDRGDGSALVVASPGAAGLGTTIISCDATDKSDGDVHTATLEVTVVAGDVATFSIVPGTPEPKTP